MTNYRNADLLERYEDVLFELTTPLKSNPANGAHQEKTGYRFAVDNRGESVPLDWYHARFNVDFKMTKLANGANLAPQGLAVADGTNAEGMVNSSHSLIKRFALKINGIDVYDCDDANHATNIKNLLEYSVAYSQCQATNEFFYIDQSRSAESREFNVHFDDPRYIQIGRKETYNKGFAVRKAQLDGGNIVNAEIPLNRYGFFEALHGELLPNSRVELNITLEDDVNLCWRSGAANAVDCRVIVTKFQLIVPRLVFNSEGKSLYLKNFLDTRKWSYLQETIYKSDETKQASGHFRLSDVNKPRHVFIFIIDTADTNTQTANKFLYKTFSVSTNARTLNSCYLEVGNGKDYPELRYQPQEEPTRVFRDLLKYVHANSDYSGDTLLNINSFKDRYPLVYFDLTKQPTDIRDGLTKLSFKYTLSGNAATDYNVYALVLHVQDIELRKTDGKLVLRSM